MVCSICVLSESGPVDVSTLRASAAEFVVFDRRFARLCNFERNQKQRNRILPRFFQFQNRLNRQVWWMASKEPQIDQNLKTETDLLTSSEFSFFVLGSGSNPALRTMAILFDRF